MIKSRETRARHVQNQPRELVSEISSSGASAGAEIALLPSEMCVKLGLAAEGDDVAGNKRNEAPAEHCAETAHHLKNNFVFYCPPCGVEFSSCPSDLRSPHDNL